MRSSYKLYLGFVLTRAITEYKIGGGWHVANPVFNSIFMPKIELAGRVTPEDQFELESDRFPDGSGYHNDKFSYESLVEDIRKKRSFGSNRYTRGFNLTVTHSYQWWIRNILASDDSPNGDRCSVGDCEHSTVKLGNAASPYCAWHIPFYKVCKADRGKMFSHTDIFSEGELRGLEHAGFTIKPAPDAYWETVGVSRMPVMPKGVPFVPREWHRLGPFSMDVFRDMVVEDGGAHHWKYSFQGQTFFARISNDGQDMVLLDSAKDLDNILKQGFDMNLCMKEHPGWFDDSPEAKERAINFLSWLYRATPGFEDTIRKIESQMNSGDQRGLMLSYVTVDRLGHCEGRDLWTLLTTGFWPAIIMENRAKVVEYLSSVYDPDALFRALPGAVFRP